MLLLSSGHALLVLLLLVTTLILLLPLPPLVPLFPLVVDPLLHGKKEAMPIA